MHVWFVLQIMDTLAEIQERHTVVRDVERKLLDLQQVSHDFLTLISFKISN